MKSDSDSGSSSLLAAVLGLYLFSASIAAVYFNWQYAQAHGFMEWVLLGETVPTLKGLVWPYFAFHQKEGEQARQDSRTSQPEVVGLTRQQVVRAEAKKLLLAMGYSQQASYLLIEDIHPNLVEHPKLKEIIRLRQKALDVANSADVEVLNSIYPELAPTFAMSSSRA